MVNEPVVKFQNVSLSDKEGNTIFHDLDFNIYNKEIIFFLGHNDNERTIILYSILGLIKPMTGFINIFGKRLSKLNPNKIYEIRKKMGYVYPQSGLLKNITIEENIVLPLQFNSSLSDKEINKRLRMIVDFFDLKDIINEKPFKLDNYIEKKILFARAIINKPRILIFDEPTTYIQQKDVCEIKILIDNIIKSDMLLPDTIILFTSEDILWAKKIAKKIIFLNKGRIDYFGESKKFEVIF